MTMVSPSLLSVDFGNMQRDIEMLNASECDWYHPERSQLYYRSRS